MTKKKLEVKGLKIRLESIQQDDFIALTDIASHFGSSKTLIQNWIRNISTIDFLEVWEKVHNHEFKGIEFDALRRKAGSNSFIMSPTKWIKTVNAKGIVSRRGKGGGTYAHTDIAMHFLMWLSPEFYVYFVKEFKRLKEEEANHKNLEWHISKITDNIDEVRNLLDTIPIQGNSLKSLTK